jgi:hypothetical protein
MKLASLWEPWATLMAIGAKLNETRHWYTPYRGWMAIHSTKGGLSMSELQAQCFENNFYQALLKYPPFAEAVATSALRKGWIRDIFPHGKIVAVVKLYDCKMFVDSEQALVGHTEIRMLPPDEPERSFGNYERGRYGLLTSDVFRLPEPIPFTSRQGKLLDVPVEIVTEIQKQWKGLREFRRIS